MTRWIVDDTPASSLDAGQSLLVSLHFVRAALLRRWRTVAVFVVAGASLALAVLILLPPASRASSTLVLAHPGTEDAESAMATDVSLLRTRAVANRVIRALGLSMSPDGFQKTVTVTTPTPEILSITLKAPTPAEAERRLGGLSLAYLAFRSEEIRDQSDRIIAGNRERIADLDQQIRTLTKQYDALVGRPGASEQARANDVLTQRSQAQAEITGLQSAIQVASVETESILAASHVVDSPYLIPRHQTRRLVLVVTSALIGGTAAGVGFVLITALLSNKLRRRDEIARALGLPVRFSGGRVDRRRPFKRHQAERSLAVLAAGLGTALDDPESTPQRLALVTVGAAEQGAAIVTRLGQELVAAGKTVFLVDLSERGVLERPAGRVEPPLTTFRPTGEVAVATGPLSLVSSHTGKLPADDPRREQWDRADVVLVLADADIGVGAGPLSTWADQGVLLVRGGRASAELLGGIAQVFSSSGVGLLFAMLVGSDWTDESAGLPRPQHHEASVRRSS